MYRRAWELCFNIQALSQIGRRHSQDMTRRDRYTKLTILTTFFFAYCLPSPWARIQSCRRWILFNQYTIETARMPTMSSTRTVTNA
ncbi:hypothetical protein BDZ89DRAFT_252411 [Hymenopellis radicata]|nr:hypothetical protein BDZ89DRAFT_252411 [Hymenopellis radicata]